MSGAKSYYRLVSFLPLIISITLIVGILIGYLVSSHQFASGEVNIASKKNREIFQLVEREYVDSLSINDFFEKSILKTLLELDPHSSYIPIRDVITQTALDSEISGIGIKFSYLRDTLFVTETIPNSPAAKSGLKPGDRILAINDSSIVGLNDQSLFSSKIRGEKGSSVRLKILRNYPKRIFEATVERNSFPFEAVDLAYMLDAKTGYIKLNRFSENSGQEIEKQLINLKKSGMKRLIFDLRDNSGGYYESAVEICDQFLKNGSEIVYTQSRGIVKDKSVAQKVGEFEYQPLVVLINENSASASEIVSSALQDNDRAIIVGRRSFGKALVQTPFKLFDGTEVRITTARYYSPSGRCIQKPYESISNYKTDIQQRLTKGELLNPDKIYKNDSLKFHTKNYRTVYGGGGVYPDVFVAIDTTSGHPVINKLNSNFVFFEFSVSFLEQNPNLTKIDLDVFALSYNISENTVFKFISFCKSKGYNITQKQLFLLKSIIKSEIKQHLAEVIWGSNGMYRMLNYKDPFILQSQDAFSHYDKILNPSQSKK